MCLNKIQSQFFLTIHYKRGDQSLFKPLLVVLWLITTIGIYFDFWLLNFSTAYISISPKYFSALFPLPPTCKFFRVIFLFTRVDQNFLFYNFHTWETSCHTISYVQKWHGISIKGLFWKLCDKYFSIYENCAISIFPYIKNFVFSKFFFWKFLG